MEREEKFSQWGLYTLMASLLAIFLITRQVGINYLDTIKDIIGFWGTGSVTLPVYENLALKLASIESVVLLSILLGMILVYTLTAILGERESIIIAILAPPGFHVSRILPVNVGEEVLARWFFMGILPQHLKLASLQTFGLIGNLIWSIIHIFNYKKSDQNPLLVLPQFVVGFLLGYMYARWGLFWTIIGHFSINAITLSVLKRKDGWVDDILYGAWYLMVLAIFGVIAKLAGISISALNPWVNQLVVPLNQLGFLSYFVLLVLVEAIVEVFLSILGYDPGAIDEESFKAFSLRNQILIGGVLVPLAYGGAYLGQKFGASRAEVAIGIAILLPLLIKTDTVSAMSRLWFKNIVTKYLLVCTIFILGFWRTLVLFFLLFWLDLVPWTMRYLISTQEWRDHLGMVRN